MRVGDDLTGLNDAAVRELHADRATTPNDDPLNGRGLPNRCARRLRGLGEATGHTAEADSLIASMRVAVAEVTTEVGGLDAPTFFHEVDNTYYTAGPGSFIADLYDEVGAENIAESTGQAFPQMSAEAIIAADPQVIILADEDAGESAGTVAARPGWGVIAAVQDGRVHVVSPDIISRPNAR